MSCGAVHDGEHDGATQTVQVKYYMVT